tara:strand:+ start:1585 stop:2469 length:885 start_codon:yes stop_codon:yes gene_type:complete
MSGHSLKPLNKLKFESIGEEFVYLHKQVFKNNPELDSDTQKSPELTIEYLREEYSRIVNEEEVEEKYEKNSVYWTVEQERAIASFISEKNTEKKERIFRENIYKPLKKLVENIIFTYKLFRSDVEIRELQEDCMSFLITKMDRYDPSKGTRAFAFFGTIAKHYLMGEKKISYKNIQSNVSLEGSNAEVSLEEGNEDRQMDLESEKVNNVVFREIVKKLERELENPKVLPNDKKVMEAIIFIFNRHEVINIYNKNLLYHLIKERTDLQTKEITYSLTRIRSMYKDFKEDFLKGLN